MKKKAFYNTIYLSPHLDDAILSCGGQIHQRSKAGDSILIITIMAGDPDNTPISDFARSLHDRWQLQTESVEARRIEDLKACLTVGAAYEHWPIPDCIYRTHPKDGKPLYPSEESIFGDIHPQEADLIKDLSELLAQIPLHESLIVPLGVGGHVDHMLTRLAAEMSSSINQLTYYEEYPYSRDESAVKHILESPESWRPHVVSLSTQDLEMKIWAIACYQSQLGSFFDNSEDMAYQVERHGRSIGGERLWLAK